jgi:hypothetical protein
VDGGELAKKPKPAGPAKAHGLVNAGKVEAVIVAKLDRLTRSVKDLCGLLELFENRKVALISVAEALDTDRPLGAWLSPSWARSANGSARPSENAPAMHSGISGAWASGIGGNPAAAQPTHDYEGDRCGLPNAARHRVAAGAGSAHPEATRSNAHT